MAGDEGFCRLNHRLGVAGSPTKILSAALQKSDDSQFWVMNARAKCLLAPASITLNRKSVEERGLFVVDGPRDAIIRFGPRREIRLRESERLVGAKLGDGADRDGLSVEIVR